MSTSCKMGWTLYQSGVGRTVPQGGGSLQQHPQEKDVYGKK